MTTQELMQKEKADVVRRESESVQRYQPPVDILESHDELLLIFDMPGVSGDHVDVTVEKGTLTVMGQADKEDDGAPVYRETYIGDYRRQFSLSDDVDTDHITADMKAGVLTIRIPKAVEAKPRKIEIQWA